MMKTKKHDVWLVLAKVEVVGDNPANLTTGSDALIQCFIPESVIETAITKATEMLITKGMIRTDVLSCNRYDAEQEFDDGAPEFLKKDVLQARNTGKPSTGTIFTSKDSASFKSNAGGKTR